MYFLIALMVRDPDHADEAMKESHPIHWDELRVFGLTDQASHTLLRVLIRDLVPGIAEQEFRVSSHNYHLAFSSTLCGKHFLSQNMRLFNTSG